jgi:hypothetical protein
MRCFQPPWCPLGRHSHSLAKSPAAPHLVSQFIVAGNAGVYDVAPDGRRFVMVRPIEGLGETELVVVPNWFEELKARVGR